MIRTRYVAVLSLLFTVAFFVEYTPLLSRAHITFDLEYFHYPLADYAFQAIHQGRFPQWDPTIYCGLSFTANTQAALFYPPTWLMIAAAWRHSRLTYQALEDLLFAHVWLTFFLCYAWLRRQKGLHPLASALGGAVLAFSGYTLMQLQHLGWIAGYAWLPLGFWGIDASAQRNCWRPLWKLVTAAALCFLAGYPPVWVGFAVCMIAYACARKGGAKIALWTSGALAASLLVAAVQVLPAWEAAQMKYPEAKFGRAGSIGPAEYFISYFLPNYFDFGPDTPVYTNLGRDYLYLGGSAFAGLGLLFFRKRLAGLGPPIVLLLASLLFLINPYGAPGRVIERFPILAQVFNAPLVGVTAAVALLAAIGLDYGLTRLPAKPAPLWLAYGSIALSLAWAIRLIVVWNSGGKFAVRWLSGVDALTAAILCGLLIFVFPGSRGRLRGCAAAALLILVAADYKAFGTTRRFHTARGRVGVNYLSQPFPGMNPGTLESLLQHPEYRLALDTTVFPSPLRHAGLTTPQGFDPFLPDQYRVLIERIGHFYSNREFDLDPDREDALRLLGVRYFLSPKQGSLYSSLSASPRFRLLQPDDSYYKVFEFVDARPAFGWEEEDAGHAAGLKIWQPETRAFTVRSASGGHFRLTEQFYPGWKATIDRMETPIDRCRQAFQCIAIPPGEHAVEFRFHTRSLALGAAISFVAVLILLTLAWPR